LLTKISEKYKNNVFIGYLNVNSIRNKLTALFSFISSNFDVLAVAESKLDSSFPNSQFEVNGYKTPYRLDITDKSGGILVFIKNGLPSVRLRSFSLPKDVQIIAIELSLKNSKWLLLCIYRPPKQNLDYFLSSLSDIMDFYNFKKCVIIGDFNTQPTNAKLISFFERQMLHCHVNFKTCWKSEQGSCIDLILSNQKNCLKSTGCIDTGVSDFHQLIYTVLSSTYTKLPPKLITYRSYHNFEQSDFLNTLSEEILRMRSFEWNYETFEFLFEAVLDRHAPVKSKMIRGNEKPHMNKELKKEIMKRSRLRNIYKQSKNASDLRAYRLQRNLVTKLNKTAKLMHFKKALQASNYGPKMFWKACEPFMTNKGSSKIEFTLKVNEKLTQNELLIANLFNEHFNTIAKKLTTFEWNSNYSSILNNPVLKAIDKYREHPSILKIKSLGPTEKFCFRRVSTKHISEIIMTLDCSKKTGGSISNKTLKLAVDIISPIITETLNNTFLSCKFPKTMKMAEIIPIPKNGNGNDIEDFRPISILPTISKIFEKVMVRQLNKFFEPKFSEILCGFRKNHSTQHALFKLLNSWQNSLDKGKIVGTILMDLSKAYDCLPHELLIAKLAAYGLDFGSLSLLHDYLSKRYQRVKIGNTFSEWLEIMLGIPQGSILGPLIFNIFLNDLFFFIQETDICNFADDNSLYASGKCVYEVMLSLQRDSENVLKWFKLNSMVANPSKFQVMFLGNKHNEIESFSVNGVDLKPSANVKLLGVTIDRKLNFRSHIDSLCASASQKVNALFRIRPYLNVHCAKQICNAYILSSFNYCPLIWMYGSKLNNKLINTVHKRAMRAVYRDFHSSFELLLRKDKSVTIHMRNLRTLLIEVYKSLNHENPKFMWTIFETKLNKYNLRSGKNLSLHRTNTHTYGMNSLSFRASMLWNNLPIALKSAKSLVEFKRKIKDWVGDCSCHICR